MYSLTHRRTGFAALALLLCFAPSLPRAAAQASPVREATVQPATNSALMLRPGDMLQVQIWREEELSGEFAIDESGRVVLPLLGERQAAAVPFETLRSTLMADYRAQLRNPSITITPLRRVYLLGEVQKPGLYTVDPTITLAGAVALAQGATSIGDLRRLRVVREGRVLHEHISAESSLSTADVRSGDQIFVDRRSWFERNSTFVVSALLSLTSIVVALTR
jgi:polysaccharide export outer membrane protein